MKMTEHLERCLELCPKGVWFNEIDVWPRIKRASYVMDKLENFGKLNARIEMSADYRTEKLYMVIEKGGNRE